MLEKKAPFLVSWWGEEPRGLVAAACVLGHAAALLQKPYRPLDSSGSGFERERIVVKGFWQAHP